MKVLDVLYKVISTSHLSEVTISDFKAMNKLKLSGFIHVHSFVTESMPRGHTKKIPSNKGKIEEAVRGMNNLLFAIDIHTYIARLQTRR